MQDASCKTIKEMQDASCEKEFVMRSPSLFSCVVLSLVFSGACLLQAIQQAGRMAPPLDDSFIHLQYATRLAEGHFWSYQGQEGCTSGATSLLWPFLLAPGSLLGLHGENLYLWAVFLGALGLGFSAWYSSRWVAKFQPELAGWVGWAVLFCGPLQWGSFSGMEIGVFAAALCGLLSCWRGSMAWFWALVLALIRPEGAVLCALWAVARIWEDRAWGTLLLVLPGGTPLLISKICSHSWLSNSILTKHNPRYTQPEEFSRLWFLVNDLLIDSFGDRYFGKGGLLAVVLMALGLSQLLDQEWKARRMGEGTKGAVVLLLMMGMMAAAVGVTFHHSRYLMPSLPIFIAFYMVGADFLRRKLDLASWPLGLALGWVLVGTFGWMNAFGKNASDIGQQQMALADWIREHTPSDARIALNDAGAIPYLSQRTVLDLEGIVSPESLRWSLAGEGSVFTLLRQQKPDFIAIFPEWFPTMAKASLFKVVARAHLDKQTISGGPEMVVALLDMLAPVGLVGGRVEVAVRWVAVVPAVGVGVAEEEAM